MGAAADQSGSAGDEQARPHEHSSYAIHQTPPAASMESTFTIGPTASEAGGRAANASLPSDSPGENVPASSSHPKPKSGRKTRGTEISPHDLFKSSNFQSRTRPQYSRPHRRPDIQGARLREKFWQTACRIYVNKKCPNVTELMRDGDEPIDWSTVIAADVYGDPTTCPICLELCHFCPRTTRCGHVYCWTCLLQFFEAEKKRSGRQETAKCPLCSEALDAEDLRPVRFQPHDILDKEQWTFIHIYRSHELQTSLATSVDEASPFDRITVLEDETKFIRDELKRLIHQRRLCVEFGFASEITDATLQAVDILADQLKGDTIVLEAEALAEFDAACQARPLHAPWEILEELATSRPLVWNLEAWRDFVHIAASRSNVNLNAPAVDLTVKEVSELVTTKGEGFHFYQSWDTQLVFLNPLFLKALLHQAGGNFASLMPIVSNVRLLLGSSIILDRTNKKSRYPFLAHLPSGLSISFYDADLSGILCESTRLAYQSLFTEAFSRYKREEKRRAKTDRQYAKQIQEKTANSELTTRLSGGVNLARPRDLDVPAEFPSLAGSSGVRSAPVVPPASPAGGQTFLQRAKNGDLGQEHYPLLESPGRPKAAPTPTPRDPLAGNWRAGGGTLGRNAASTVSYLSASTVIASLQRVEQEEPESDTHQEIVVQRRGKKRIAARRLLFDL